MLHFWCLVLATGLLPPSQGLLNLGSVLGLSPAQPNDGLLGTGLGSKDLINKKSGLLGTGLSGEGGLFGTSILSTGSLSGKESGGSSDAGKEPSSSGILGTGLLGGQPGSSGLLGTGILGGDGLLDTGILGGDGLLDTGILGGDGLLDTGILGGEGLGNGLLSNGLLGNTSLLGQKGLLGTGLLGKGLLGNGSLLGPDGLLGAGGLLGSGVPGTPTHFSWLKVLNLENVRVSCRVIHGSEFVLNLYSKLVLRLPGIFQFLSGSLVETNITSHVALTQDTPGDLKLVFKDCSNLLMGFKVNLRRGFLTNMVSNLLNSSLRSLIPALLFVGSNSNGIALGYGITCTQLLCERPGSEALCPLVNIWVSIINIKLQFLNRVVSFGLLGKIHSALSSLPVSSGHYVELDLQNYPFPSAFIDWLLQITGINLGSTP